MKDYTLSEIKAHCKARVANKYQNPCNGCEMEVVCKSTLPLGWEIEPRDMIDLPCKLPAVSGKQLQVAYRDKYGYVHSKPYDLDEEPEADAFLADLKGGKA